MSELLGHLLDLFVDFFLVLVRDLWLRLVIVLDLVEFEFDLLRLLFPKLRLLMTFDRRVLVFLRERLLG